MSPLEDLPLLKNVVKPTVLYYSNCRK